MFIFGAGGGSPQVYWDAAVSNPGSFYFNITSSNDLLVAVGGSAACVTSSDGATWTSNSGLLSAVGSYYIRTITHNGTVFVASGDSSKTATSTDGATWVDRTAAVVAAWGTTYTGYSLAVKSSRIVLGGASGKVVYSDDNGVSWTNTSSLSSTLWGTRNIFRIFSDGTYFFVISGDGHVARSSDGASWVYLGIVDVNASNAGADICRHSDGKLYAYYWTNLTSDCRIISSSDDGATWGGMIEETSTGGYPQILRSYMGSLWLIKTNNYVLTSINDTPTISTKNYVDGAIWLSTYYIYDIEFFKGKIILAGDRMYGGTLGYSTP